MRSKVDILNLLDELDLVIADDLENDTLDFKLDIDNPKERANLIVDTVVCFANSKGRTLVLGVKDKLPQANRKHASIGVSSSLNISKLQEQIYNKTDPHITPHIEFLEIPEGRLLLVHVDQGTSPPYTNSAGQGTRRVGKNCLPLTGSMMRDLRLHSESIDFSARTIMDAELVDLVSPAEMTRLRVLAEESRVSAELLQQSDTEVLEAV